MISVCVATYNGEKYIREQLGSVLSQLGTSDEVIVSDDRSKDKTLDIVRAFNDSRIKIVEGPGCGLTKNFENALNHVSGNYVFFCDQDDVWCSDKVSVMMSYLQKYSVVISDCKVVDRNLKIQNDSYFSIVNSGPGFFKNLCHNTYIGCCMAFRAELLKETLPFPKNIIMHDVWIALYADLCYNTCFVNQKLSLYRRHGDNASSSSEKSSLSVWFRVKFRVHLLACLLIRYAKWHILSKPGKRL